MLGEEKVKELCQQVLRRRGSGELEVQVYVDDQSLTRFTNNAIHQNVNESNLRIVAHYIDRKRSGIASTNRLDAPALDETIERARASAQASPENPNFPGLTEPASYAPVNDFDELTAAISPAERAEAVGTVCRRASEKQLNASGAYMTGVTELAIANSQGLFAYHGATRADFQTVVMSSDSSGWAQQSAWSAGEIPVEALGKEAIEKAERGRRPRPVEVGEYTVILDPYATEDIVTSLDFYGMSAMDYQEGQSWMNDRLGQQVMDSQVSIWDDGRDPSGLPRPFDFEGTPKRRTEIVRRGTPISPVYDRETARKAGVETTGHGLTPDLRAKGPLAINLFMQPGEMALEEMIRSTSKGLYITRFWYTRLVHPRDCVITGMTRDGVFMIENGEITYPVKNLRFTQSYVDALAGVEGISRETSLMSSFFLNLALRVPALKLSRFNFTGATV